MARVRRTGERDPEYHRALKELEEEEIAVQAEPVPNGRKAEENEGAVQAGPDRMAGRPRKKKEWGR